MMNKSYWFSRKRT